MSASNNLTSYADCFELFDRALASEHGAQRVYPGDHHGRSAAFTFRMRMNKARQNDRANNQKIYAEDPLNPLYGKSVYDRFTLKVIYDQDRDRWLVQARVNRIDEGDIEEITDAEPAPPSLDEFMEAEGLESDA